MSKSAADHFTERDALPSFSRIVRDGRPPPSFNLNPGNRTLGSSLAPSANQPGSFSTDLRSTASSRTDLQRPELVSFLSARTPRIGEEDGQDTIDKRVADLRERIEKETKIKIGSENLLEALNSKNPKQTRDQRVRVESELNISNRKIAQLKLGLEAEIQRSKERSPSPAGKSSNLFRSFPSRSQSHHEADEDYSFDEDTESPTFVLAEILQSLESAGKPAEYYVERANNLVDLFKRHPTLKYDLAWSIFGLRVQMMLLSESREVVAASYRVMRHAITDRRSLSIMRSFHTDYLVITSVVKESKASVEREQALKFIRAFLDVKGGTEELSRSVVRVIVAVAEHQDDRMRSICILTLAELLVRDPALVVSAGGVGVLADALADGTYQPTQSLTSAFLYLLDTPARRAFLKSGHELDGPLSVFTDGSSVDNEERLKSSAKVVSSILKSWHGLLSYSNYGSNSLRSLVAALHVPSLIQRNVVLELLFDILRIKPPSWSSSFLAGRRLTTYGRVANMNNDRLASAKVQGDQFPPREELVEHFTAVLLASLLRTGLVDALLLILEDENDATAKRKTTLLLSEVLNMAHDLLPTSWSSDIQMLPSLFQKASTHLENRHVASSTIYQLESVSRTLFRTAQLKDNEPLRPVVPRPRSASELAKDELTPQIEESHFRAVIMDTQVLATVNYSKWNWDLVQKIIEGPLLNAKRLEEATKANKFLKRVMGFYRPFKYRFSDILNTKYHQRYVRVGCALIKTLLQTQEGVRYLAEDKLLRQIAECLAQVDRLSGLISSSPLFSSDRLTETLASGYFAMLGVLTSSSEGLRMMERWKMINMIYHIVELEGRDDLIKILLGNMDYTLDSHLRIIISKALTSCSTNIRIYAARILRKYATRQNITTNAAAAEACAEWAIQLLITQLYDPEVEVSEVAVKILEEACNDSTSLEFVVRCRPALDHLGEIGAPLLLRFLSTSIGYHYLDGLDYISQEMDDWFLGRNDNYVTLVEASMAKALATSQSGRRPPLNDQEEPPNYGIAPPHFYRELTRTAEGCKLLENKGHFEEFVAVIQAHGMESEDAEVVLKTKGCLWAVANVGSMELGAPFLESSDVVETIVKIAEESVVMSMRGTAFFALGLISRSIHGQEILAEHGWDVTFDNMGESRGICLPMDLKKLFTVRCCCLRELPIYTDIA